MPVLRALQQAVLRGSTEVSARQRKIQLASHAWAKWAVLMRTTVLLIDQAWSRCISKHMLAALLDARKDFGTKHLKHAHLAAR